MLRMVRWGFLLPVLVLVASEVQWSDVTGCDDASQGCDVEDALPNEELQGLDLLQKEMRLQSDTLGAAAARPESSPAESSSAARKAAAPSTRVGKATLAAAKTAARPAAKEVDLATHTGTLARGVAVQSLATNISLDVGFLSAILNFDAYVKLRCGTRDSRSIMVAFSIFFIVVVVAYLAAPVLLAKERQNRSASHYRDDSRLIPARAMSSQSGAAEQLLQAPQSVAKSSENGRGNPAGPACDGPPAICPSLILPHTEARFMIPIESLMRASGELDIRGTSRRKLLDGSVTEAVDGCRSLALASCGCEDDPRITVLAAPCASDKGPLSGGAATGFGKMDIYAKGGVFYGTIEASCVGGAVLRCQGQTVMTLEQGPEDLSMTSSSPDGRLLASAGKNVQFANRRMESHDTWNVQVKPGVDALLVAACMLGVLLFGQ